MRLIGFLKQIFQAFGRDKVGQLSAAFAYGAIFALGPLLLVLTAIVGIVYGQQAAQGKLHDQLAGSVGPSAARTLQDVVANLHHTGSGAISLTIGIVGMLLAAAAITSQLQNGFDELFDAVHDPKGGIKLTVYVKFKNALLVIFGGLIVIASLVISAVVAGIGTTLQRHTGLPPVGLELLNDLVSLVILTGLLYALYRVVPDVVIPAKILLAASFIVAVLFSIGKVVLAYIIGRNGTASAYGAAASLISLLLWIYYSGQILFLGAEGMKIYAFNRSLEYRPKRYTLHRTTIHIDGKDIRSRIGEAWVRGYRKAVRK
jgi:membrane protein